MCNDCSDRYLRDNRGNFVSMAGLVLKITDWLQPSVSADLSALPTLEQIAALVRDKYSQAYNPSNKEIKSWLQDLVVKGHLYAVQHGSKTVYQVGDSKLLRQRIARDPEPKKSAEELPVKEIKRDIVSRVVKHQANSRQNEQRDLIMYIQTVYHSHDLSRTKIKSFIDTLVKDCELIECRTGYMIYYTPNKNV